MATGRVVCRSSPLAARFSKTSTNKESPKTIIQQPSTSSSSLPPTTRMEAVKQLLRMSGFSRKASTVIASSDSPLNLYQGKRKIFLGWCNERKIHPLKTAVKDVADFLLYLRHKKNLSVSAIKGYRAALSKVFKTSSIDLFMSWELSDLVKHFEKSCSPRVLTPPEWDVIKVLSSLTKSPYEPIKTSLDQDLMLKTVFLLALASAKRIGELHGISPEVTHTRG